MAMASPTWLANISGNNVSIYRTAAACSVRLQTSLWGGPDLCRDQDATRWQARPGRGEYRQQQRFGPARHRQRSLWFGHRLRRGNESASVAIGDVNGDGKLTCRGEFHQQRLDPARHRPGAFGSATDHCGDESGFVAIGDVNGDGKPDLVVGNVGSNSVSILLNTAPVVDSDGDGIADDIDNSPSIYNPGQPDKDGDGVGDGSDICPNYSDNSICNYQETLATVPPVPQGTPLLVTATFRNDSGVDILTFPPDCYNTYFELSYVGGILPPTYRHRKAYAIPDELITIPAGGQISITCDLSRMFDVSVLVPGRTASRRPTRITFAIRILTIKAFARMRHAPISGSAPRLPNRSRSPLRLYWATLRCKG
jgi:hypothetical protein